jgi:hypothetical protein
MAVIANLSISESDDTLTAVLGTAFSSAKLVASARKVGTITATSKTGTVVASAKVGSVQATAKK